MRHYASLWPTMTIVFVFCCFLSAARVMGQEESPAAREPLRVISFSGDMGTLLGHLAIEYRSPIGFELAAKQQGVAVNIYLRDATFHQILDGIVKSAHGYQWRERDSAIEVLPTEGASPLLDTIIHNFQPQDVDQSSALNQLIGQPEIRDAMIAMGLKRRVAMPAERASRKISLKLDGVTMRQALNRITKEYGSGVWIFSRGVDGSFSIKILSD